MVTVGILSVSTLLCSCVSEECIGNRNSLPLAGFYSSTLTPEVIRVDSIKVYGVGAPGDSVLHSSPSAISELYLPFRLEGGSTTYVIKYMQKEFETLGLEDRITFRYETEPRFVSAACGAMYDFRIMGIDYTTNLIDSVTCPYGVIDNNNVENLRIYFRTQSSEE